jgi:hypothetical protein
MTQTWHSLNSSAGKLKQLMPLLPLSMCNCILTSAMLVYCASEFQWAARLAVRVLLQGSSCCLHARSAMNFVSCEGLMQQWWAAADLQVQQMVAGHTAGYKGALLQHLAGDSAPVACTCGHRYAASASPALRTAGHLLVLCCARWLIPCCGCCNGQVQVHSLQVHHKCQPGNMAGPG